VFFRGEVVPYAASSAAWRTWAVLALLAAAVTGLSGCATVQPWQRGTMADYTMRPDRDPLTDSQREHIFFTREAASGGRGVGGGGCGCN
jgi:type IV pilus biogenesis protein CpaD/CtpE